MQNNKDFNLKWKSIHEKGLRRYLIRKSLPPLVILYLANFIIIYSHRPVDKVTLHYIIFYIFLGSFVIIWSGLKQWFRGERKYYELNKNAFSG